MSDLCEQLRALAEELPAQIRRTYPSGETKELPNDLMDEAADEIASLRAQLASAKEDLASCQESWHRVMNNKLAVDKQLASARKVVDAARAYYLCAVQDEADDLECCCTENQHELAKALRDALSDETGMRVSASYLERVARDWQQAFQRAHGRSPPAVEWVRGWFRIGVGPFRQGYRRAQLEQMTKVLREGFDD